MSHALPPSSVLNYTGKMISDARTGVPGTWALLEEVDKKWIRSREVFVFTGILVDPVGSLGWMCSWGLSRDTYVKTLARD